MKLKNLFIYNLFFSLIFMFSSCNVLYRADNIHQRSNEIKTLTKDSSTPSPEVGNSPVYSALIVTDIHFGKSRERYDQDFLTKFKSLCEQEDETLRPKFIICLGDLVDGGKESDFIDFTNFTSEIIEIANTAYNTDDFKVYSIIGNHDLYNNGWKNFVSHIFPYTSYYRFTTKSNSLDSNNEFSWYFLDSGDGSLGYNQLKNFKLNAKADSNPKIVLTHFPVWDDGILYFKTQNSEERDILLDTLNKTNVKLLLHGHYHPGGNFDYGNFQEAGIKSYVAFQEYALLTVDEVTGTYKLQTQSFRN